MPLCRAHMCVQQILQTPGHCKITLPQFQHCCAMVFANDNCRNHTWLPLNCQEVRESFTFKQKTINHSAIDRNRRTQRYFCRQIKIINPTISSITNTARAPSLTCCVDRTYRWSEFKCHIASGLLLLCL